MVSTTQINIKSKKMLGALQEMKKRFPETAKRISIEYAEATKKEAVSGIIPVRTGNLRSTARVEKGLNSVSFKVGGIQGDGSPSKYVSYARYVNSGTSRQSPQFYMERSLNSVSSKKNSIIKKALDSWTNIIES